MANLFFDIESCNNQNKYGNICEFGYILVSDDFEILEKDNIIINPDTKFEKYVEQHILTRKKEEYESCDTYPKYYERIKTLIENNRVFGHSINNDAKYLNGDSLRYNLPYINFKFIDIKLIYEMISKATTGLGLLHLAEKLEIEHEDNEHDALFDATLTFKCFKKICQNEKSSIDEIIRDYGKLCEGQTLDGQITIRINNPAAKKKPLTYSLKDKFKKFKKTGANKDTENNVKH